MKINKENITNILIIFLTPLLLGKIKGDIWIGISMAIPLLVFIYFVLSVPNTISKTRNLSTTDSKIIKTLTIYSVILWLQGQYDWNVPIINDIFLISKYSAYLFWGTAFVLSLICKTKILDSNNTRTAQKTIKSKRKSK